MYCHCCNTLSPCQQVVIDYIIRRRLLYTRAANASETTLQDLIDPEVGGAATDAEVGGAGHMASEDLEAPLLESMRITVLNVDGSFSSLSCLARHRQGAGAATASVKAPIHNTAAVTTDTCIEPPACCTMAPRFLALRPFPTLLKLKEQNPVLLFKYERRMG